MNVGYDDRSTHSSRQNPRASGRRILKPPSQVVTPTQTLCKSIDGSLLGESDEPVGLSLGCIDGCALGHRLGNNDGKLLGSAEGWLLGVVLGSSDGDAVGSCDGMGDPVGEVGPGDVVGSLLGDNEGTPLGSAVGVEEGLSLGSELGACDGEVLGMLLGDNEGT